MSIRPVIETRRASPHIEGAGVHRHRAFGFQVPDACGFRMFSPSASGLPTSALS